MTVGASTPADSSLPMLQAVGLVKEFGGVPALDGVDFSVMPGSVEALLGANGSGKSTLIRALAGIAPADSGVVEVGRTRFDAGDLSPRVARANGLRFVHQQPSTFPTMSVAENLALGHGWESDRARRIHWREQCRRATEVLTRFEIDVDPRAPLGTYSMATQTMIVVARAMQDLGDAGVLVLDEPTSAFPPAQVDLLLDFVRDFASRGHAVVYVSHRLDEVVQVADRATILRDGKVATTVSPDLSRGRR